MFLRVALGACLGRGGGLGPKKYPDSKRASNRRLLRGFLCLLEIDGSLAVVEHGAQLGCLRRCHVALRLQHEEHGGQSGLQSCRFQIEPLPTRRTAARVRRYFGNSVLRVGKSLRCRPAIGGGHAFQSR